MIINLGGFDFLCSSNTGLLNLSIAPTCLAATGYSPRMPCGDWIVTQNALQCHSQQRLLPTKKMAYDPQFGNHYSNTSLS